MIAVDTNVLARWVFRDDEAQFQAANDVLSEPFYVSWTVMLELAWLLGSYGGLPRAKQADVLETVLALPTVRFDRPDRLRWAVERFRKAGDIADLIHVAASADASAFVSFEKNLGRHAGPDAPLPIQRVG